MRTLGRSLSGGDRKAAEVTACARTRTTASTASLLATATGRETKKEATARAKKYTVINVFIQRTAQPIPD